MKHFGRVVAVTFFFVYAAFNSGATPTTNGLYAAFNTSKGTFYCNLRYDLAPRTVANFVGLAGGTKSWLNWTNGAIAARPYYNGITFHRMQAGLFIQGGSQLGDGTDDPGYTFKNEINTNLNFNTGGILAMANTGTTNSNGAQFFITLSAYTPWNNNYTVFGNVAEGMGVVSNINSVATDTNGKPLVPIIISNVTLLRIGTSASNFNAATVSPALPVPRFKASTISQSSSSGILMLWNQLPGYEYRFCYTGDLRNWTVFYLGPYTGRYLNDFHAYFTQEQFFTAVESLIDQ